MSGITGISVAAPQMLPANVAPGPTAQTLTTSGNAAQPADVVSLSSAAAASAAPASPGLRSMDPSQVDKALTQVSGANGFAFAYAHFDQALIAAKFGDAIAERDEAGLRGAAVGSASDAISAAREVGIPVHASVSPEDGNNGATPGTIAVAAFSFTSGGSTYSVAPGANGTLVGTKDGQAWQMWQLTDPDIKGNTASTTSADAGAATALQTLTSLNAQSTSSAAKSSSPFDILA